MTISNEVSVNVDGVVYQRKNGKYFIDQREVSGQEAALVQRKIEESQKFNTKFRKKIDEHVSKIRQHIRSIWS